MIKEPMLIQDLQAEKLNKLTAAVEFFLIRHPLG